MASLAHGQDPNTGGVREITARVIDEENHPVSGVRVDLIGLGRGPMTSRDEIDAQPGTPKAAKAKGWHFVTDRTGRCTVMFGKFDFWGHQQSTGVAEPGYGSYFLVVEKEGEAGGVSRKIFNWSEEDRKKFVPTELGASGPNEGEEWDYDPRVLSDDPKDLEPIEIILKHGIDVSGRLEDEHGRPIRGQEISLWNNLGADTHSGRGGESFEREVTTDEKGHFQFHHVYPNLFHLALADQQDDTLCWLKTRVRKRWVDGVHDAIWPHTDDKDLPLVIVATRTLPYRYLGKITDENGRPVGGATIRIQAAIHGPGELQDFADSHDHYRQTVSKKDGSYEVRAAGPYVNMFRITAPGFEDSEYIEDGEIYGFDRYEEEPCAPGRYDFILKRK